MVFQCCCCSTSRTISTTSVDEPPSGFESHMQPKFVMSSPPRLPHARLVVYKCTFTWLTGGLTTGLAEPTQQIVARSTDHLCGGELSARRSCTTICRVNSGNSSSGRKGRSGRAMPMQQIAFNALVRLQKTLVR